MSWAPHWPASSAPFLPPTAGATSRPTPAEFYQPLIGDGPFAVTRAAVVILLSVALIGFVLVRSTRRAAIVPSRGQWMTESVYGLVRNGVARDIIGSKDFLRFVPMLFTLFMLILVNNLFGVIPLGPVPDDEPDRLPDRADADRLRGLPLARHQEERLRRLLQEPRAARAARLDRADDLRARAHHVLHHPAGHARAATLRQHVRRPPAAAAVHHRRRVHGHPRQPSG